MELEFFVKGLLIGFSIAAPVGPIGVLCIRTTLAQGRAFGLATGLGAATADMLYGAVAAFGLTLITNLLVSQQFWLRLVGGLFLLYLGYKVFRSEPASLAAGGRTGSLAGAYVSTLGLTLTNPTTILSFVAIFGGLGLGAGTGQGGWTAATVMVGGVLLGSALWWLILTGLVGAFRQRLGSGALRLVNRFSGLLVAGFGLLALLSLVT